MLPRILKAPTLQILGELLVNAGCNHEVVTEFFDSLRTCWPSNFANTTINCMRFLKNLAYPSAPPWFTLSWSLYEYVWEDSFLLLPCVLYWHSYVDDVMCLWEGYQPLTYEFPNFPVSLFFSIRFTMEVQLVIISFISPSRSIVALVLSLFLKIVGHATRPSMVSLFVFGHRNWWHLIAISMSKNYE